MNKKVMIQALETFAQGFMLLAESLKEETTLVSNIRVARDIEESEDVDIIVHENDDVEFTTIPHDEENPVTELRGFKQEVEIDSDETILIGNIQVAGDVEEDLEDEDIEESDEVIEETPKTVLVGNIEVAEDVEEDTGSEEQVENGQATVSVYEDSLLDMLNSKTLSELAEICTDFDLSTKGKKQALIDRLIENVDREELIEYLEALGDGISIEEEEEEVPKTVLVGNVSQVSSVEEDEEELDETTKMYIESIEITDDDIIEEICKREGIKGGKKELIEAVKNHIVDISKYFADDEEVEEDTTNDEEVEYTEAELSVIEEIDRQLEEGELTIRKIKKFLEKYMDKNIIAEKSDYELERIYKDIHVALVDDDDVIHEFEEPYVRHGEYHCCGEPIKRLSDGLYVCEVCGSEYED